MAYDFILITSQQSNIIKFLNTFSVLLVSDSSDSSTIKDGLWDRIRKYITNESQLETPPVILFKTTSCPKSNNEVSYSVDVNKDHRNPALSDTFFSSFAGKAKATVQLFQEKVSCPSIIVTISEPFTLFFRAIKEALTKIIELKIVLVSLLAVIFTKWVIGRRDHVIYGVNPRDLEAMQLSRVKFAEEYRNQALQKADEIRKMLVDKEKAITESFKIKEELRNEIFLLETQLTNVRVDLTISADEKKSAVAENHVFKEDLKKSKEKCNLLQSIISNNEKAIQQHAEQIEFLNSTVDVIVVEIKKCQEQLENVRRLREDFDSAMRQQENPDVLQQEGGVAPYVEQESADDQVSNLEAPSERRIQRPEDVSLLTPIYLEVATTIATEILMAILF